MPRLSTWFVRASLVYLAVGFSLGALLLANKAMPFYPSIWNLLPIHSEILLLGWFAQLAMGVAYWILPRIKGPDPRGNQRLAFLSFWLVNTGISLILLHTITSQSVLLLAGRLVESAGVLAFVYTSWQRVKSFAS